MRKQQGTLKLSMISLLVASSLLGCGGGGDESSGASDDSSNSNTVGATRQQPTVTSQTLYSPILMVIVSNIPATTHPM